MRIVKKLTVSTLFILTGCASLVPEYQRPTLPVPLLFSLSHNRFVSASAVYQDTGWKAFFGNPQIRYVIAKALTNNPDLKMAILKVQEARAQYNITDTDRYPQLDASSQADYQRRISDSKTMQKEYIASLDLSIDLDIFGRLKYMSKAERQRYFATQEAQRNIHILLISDVSQSYYNQKLALAQLKIARETLQNYLQSYSLIEQQLINGRTTTLALEQSKGLIESTRADIANREGQLAQATTALYLLIGRNDPLPDTLTDEAADLRPILLPENLPSAILLQRPDIMEAERHLKAADADIGAARAAFFPSISLTSGLSASSMDLSNLFTPDSGMWNFLPKITLPIFNAGRNEANLVLAKVRQQQWVVNYEQKIQGAFKEVSDTLSRRDSIIDQISARERYLGALKITVLRATKLYENGATSYIEVLNAERELFSNQQSLLELKYSKQINEIKLFTALGGGWVE